MRSLVARRRLGKRKKSRMSWTGKRQAAAVNSIGAGSSGRSDEIRNKRRRWGGEGGVREERERDGQDERANAASGNASDFNDRLIPKEEDRRAMVTRKEAERIVRSSHHLSTPDRCRVKQSERRRDAESEAGNGKEILDIQFSSFFALPSSLPLFAVCKTSVRQAVNAVSFMCQSVTLLLTMSAGFFSRDSNQNWSAASAALASIWRVSVDRCFVYACMRACVLTSV